MADLAKLCSASASGEAASGGVSWKNSGWAILTPSCMSGQALAVFPGIFLPTPPLTPRCYLPRILPEQKHFQERGGGGGLSVHLGTRVSREGGNFKGGGSHLFPGAQDAEPPLRLDFDVESALHGTSSGGSSQTVRQRGGWKFLGSLQWIPGTAKSHLNEDPHPLYELQIRAGIVANCIHHWPHIGEALIHGLQL